MTVGGLRRRAALYLHLSNDSLRRARVYRAAWERELTRAEVYAEQHDHLEALADLLDVGEGQPLFQTRTEAA